MISPVRIVKKSRADWRVVGSISTISDQPWSTVAILLVDEDGGGMSVTNDADNVVHDLYHMYGDLIFIYRDSEGNWDELSHDKGRFLGFNILSRREWSEIMSKVVRNHG